MSSETEVSNIHISNENHILTLQINRPAKKNALTIAMYKELTRALENAAKDDNTRLVLFKGTKEIFTAGNDLLDFMNTPPSKENSAVLDFIECVQNYPKVIVAQVQGAAIGIGTTILLHCDFIYADESAKFKMPFVSLGLCPEAASSFLIPRIIGHAKASELLLLGRSFSAKEADQFGILSAIVPAEELESHVQKICNTLSKLPPSALRQSKALLKNPLREKTQLSVMSEAEIFMKQLVSPEALEAMSAFFEKRPADFSNFS